MSLQVHQFEDETQAVAELELTTIEHAQLMAALEALSALQARARARKDNRRLESTRAACNG